MTNAIKEIWCREITPTYLKTLSDSMPKRLNLVLEAEGGRTKY